MSRWPPVRRFLCRIRFIAIASSSTTRASSKRAGGAIIVNDDDNLGANLAREIERLASNPRLLREMGDKAHGAVPSDAAQKVAQVCFDVVDRRRVIRVTQSSSTSLLNRQRRLHFIGIGGAGMSGIAELSLRLGFAISGCDLKDGPVTARLKSLGAQIDTGHHAAHIKPELDAVVISSAVKFSNPEVARAREMKIPVIPRAEMLGELLRMARVGIAVAGTHGKTTTTGLVGLILEEAGLDPTVAIGGNLRSRGSNVRLGRGDYMVAEADESDASFLLLVPTLAIVTNIDPEHLDHYGNIDRVRDAFLSFINHVPFYGAAVLGIDSVNVRGLLPSIRKPVITYGLAPDADLRAEKIVIDGLSTRFEVVRKGEVLGEVNDSNSGCACCDEFAGRDRGRAGVGNHLRGRGESAGEVFRHQPPLRDQGRGRRAHRHR